MFGFFISLSSHLQQPGLTRDFITSHVAILGRLRLAMPSRTLAEGYFMDWHFTTPFFPIGPNLPVCISDAISISEYRKYRYFPFDISIFHIDIFHTDIQYGISIFFLSGNSGIRCRQEMKKNCFHIAEHFIEESSDRTKTNKMYMYTRHAVRGSEIQQNNEICICYSINILLTCKNVEKHLFL